MILQLYNSRNGAAKGDPYEMLFDARFDNASRMN